MCHSYIESATALSDFMTLSLMGKNKFIVKMNINAVSCLEQDAR